MFWISSQIHVGRYSQQPWAAYRQEAEGGRLMVHETSRHLSALDLLFSRQVHYGYHSHFTGRKEQNIWWQLLVTTITDLSKRFLPFSSPAAYTPSCCPFSCGTALCWGAWDWRVFGETSQIHCQECLLGHILCHLPCLIFKLYVVLVCSAPHQHVHVLSQLSHIFFKKNHPIWGGEACELLIPSHRMKC